MGYFVDEVACFSWRIEVVHVFCDREMFVTMAGVEVCMLLKGGMGGCDGTIACDRSIVKCCWLESVA